MRMIELGTLLAGPFAGRLLGDMGAEIIKVEAPGKPDPLRDWGQARYEGRTLWWPVQSRNKKCITLNLREARGPGAAARARPRGGRRSPRTSARARSSAGTSATTGSPRRTPASSSRASPATARPARTPSAPASRRSPRRWAGSATSTASRARRRRAPGISLGDSLAAMFAVQGILAALYHRDVLGGRPRPGRRRLADGGVASRCSRAPCPSTTGSAIVREPPGTRLKGIAPSNIFKSRDDLWMVIAANQDNVFRRLCEAMGRPELADDPRFATHLARGENQEEIEGIVADWAARARRRRDRPHPQRGRCRLRPDLHRRRDLRGPAVRGARDARRARRPGVRPVHRAGHRAEVLRARPARCAGRAPGRRAATTRRSTAGCSA